MADDEYDAIEAELAEIIRDTSPTVHKIANAPYSPDDMTVERRVEGKQVVSRYVRKSDGTPIAGLSETYHLMGVEGGFQPPPT